MMRRRAILPALALALSSTAGACDRGARGMDPIVRDSAGVRIILSAQPAWQAADAWTIAAEPILDAGPAEPSAGPVRGVVRLGDGIVVANGGNGTVQFFDAAGRLTRTIGGADSTAGLFAINGLERTGDRLYVSQRFGQPAGEFDLEGGFIRWVRPDSQHARPFISAFWPLEDGAMLLFSSPHGLLPRREPWTEPATFLRAEPGPPAERVLSLPGVRLARVSTGVERVLFSPVLQFVVHGERIWAGYPDRWAIGEYDVRGNQLRSVRRAWEPEPVTTAQRERVRALLREAVDAAFETMPEPLQNAPQRTVADSIPFAATHPAFGRILLSDDAHLWVERTDTAWRPDRAGPLPVADHALAWDVFDADGRWLGAVEMPARFHATAIGTDDVTGVWRGVDGTERPRVYRLIRPGTPSG